MNTRNVLFALLIPLFLVASSYAIKISVQDKIAGKPVPGVLVAANDNQTYCITGINGSCEIKTSIRRLYLHKYGYQDLEVFVSQDQGEANMTLAMKPLAIFNFSETKEYPVAMVFVVDVSNSMVWYNLGPGTPNRLTFAKALMKAIAERTDYPIGIVSFCESSRVVLEPTRDKEKIINAIKGLGPCDATCVGSGLGAGVSLLDKTPAKIKYLILLTDGCDYSWGGCPSWDYPLEQARNENIRTFIIGIGSKEEYCGGRLSWAANYTNGTFMEGNNAYKLVDALYHTYEFANGVTWTAKPGSGKLALRTFFLGNETSVRAIYNGKKKTTPFEEEGMHELGYVFHTVYIPRQSYILPRSFSVYTPSDTDIFVNLTLYPSEELLDLNFLLPEGKLAKIKLGNNFTSNEYLVGRSDHLLKKKMLVPSNLEVMDKRLGILAWKPVNSTNWTFLYNNKILVNESMDIVLNWACETSNDCPVGQFCTSGVCKPSNLHLVFVPVNNFDMNSLKKFSKIAMKHVEKMYPRVETLVSKGFVTYDLYRPSFNINHSDGTCNWLLSMERRIFREIGQGRGVSRNTVIVFVDNYRLKYKSNVVGYTCPELGNPYELGGHSIYIGYAYPSVLSHELGHILGLTDEYNRRLNGDPNRLSERYGCDPFGDCCWGDCSGDDPCCKGNKNKNGGRSIMSYLDVNWGRCTFNYSKSPFDVYEECGNEITRKEGFDEPSLIWLKSHKALGDEVIMYV